MTPRLSPAAKLSKLLDSTADVLMRIVMTEKLTSADAFRLGIYLENTRKIAAKYPQGLPHFFNGILEFFNEIQELLRFKMVSKLFSIDKKVPEGVFSLLTTFMQARADSADFNFVEETFYLLKAKLSFNKGVSDFGETVLVAGVNAFYTKIKEFIAGVNAGLYYQEEAKPLAQEFNSALVIR